MWASFLITSTPSPPPLCSQLCLLIMYSCPILYWSPGRGFQRGVWRWGGGREGDKNSDEKTWSTKQNHQKPSKVTKYNWSDFWLYYLWHPKIILLYFWNNPHFIKSIKSTLAGLMSHRGFSVTASLDLVGPSACWGINTVPPKTDKVWGNA